MSEFKTVQIKRSTKGELAINLADKKLFSKDSGGNVFVVSDKSTEATKLTTTNWVVEEVSGVLFFKHNGVNKAKLDSSGNFTTTGNITAYGTV